MAVVTFMSDFGTGDHYVAAVKAAILKVNSQAQIVDISHTIEPSDIGHAAYVLGNVFRDFPLGTTHLCAIDNALREPSPMVALELEDHFFLGADSGLFSLLSAKQPTAIVKLEGSQGTFGARNVLAPAAAALANGTALSSLGQSTTDLKTLYSRQLKVTKREIAGNVVRVDHYGNLISNITKTEFDAVTKVNGNAPFEVCFGRERCPVFHRSFQEVDSGEYFVFFNSNGLLQIGIHKGNASELLGIQLDAPVNILFQL